MHTFPFFSSMSSILEKSLNDLFALFTVNECGNNDLYNKKNNEENINIR